MHESKYCNLVIRERGTCIPHPTLLPGSSCVNTLLYYHLTCNVKHAEGHWPQLGGRKDQMCTTGGRRTDHNFDISKKRKLRWNYTSCCIARTCPREFSPVLQSTALLSATLQTISETGFLLGSQIIQGLRLQMQIPWCVILIYFLAVTATQREITIRRAEREALLWYSIFNR